MKIKYYIGLTSKNVTRTIITERAVEEVAKSWYPRGRYRSRIENIQKLDE